MKSLMHELRRWALADPGRSAIVCDSQRLSYSQVDALSDILASELSQQGISQGCIVPLLMTPSAELVLTIFALHKLGAGYLPIALDLPAARKEFLLSQSDCPLILVNSRYTLVPTSRRLLNVDVCELAAKPAVTRSIEHFPDAVSYVIHTSGSTGTPKGVLVSQRNLAIMMESLQEQCPCLQDDVYLLSTPYSFDVSVSEIFGWILGGASLVISRFESKKRMEETLRLFEQNRVTHAAFTPSVLHAMMQVASPLIKKAMNDSLKYCMLAGEALPVSFSRELKNSLPSVRFFNLYGPTETTIYATFFEVDEECLRSDEVTVPIGYPLSGVECMIVDENLQPANEGELLIGGSGVSLGYLNDPTKTENSFITVDGRRFYRTGDLVKKKNETLIFLGRRDHQVKINGVRVELSEIESHLSAQGASQVCVLYTDKKLVGFVNRMGGLTEDEFRTQLLKTLPEAMVPARVLEIAQWPLTGSGKTDRKLLLEHWQNALASQPVRRQLSDDPVVQRICSLFAEVLNLNAAVSADFEFFDGGGDSLAYVTLLSLLERSFEMELPFDFIRSNSTPVDLARQLKLMRGEEGSPRDALSLSSVGVAVELDECLAKQSQFFGALHSSFADAQAQEPFLASNFQRSYFNFGFVSHLVAEVNVPREHSHSEILSALQRMADSCDFMRIRLFEKDGDVFAYETNDLLLPPAPVHSLQGLSDDEIERRKAALWKQSCAAIDVKTQNSPLYDIHVFSNPDSSTLIRFVLHHAIADAASLPIVQRLVHDFIKNKKPAVPSFRDYLSVLRNSKTAAEVCALPFTAELEEGMALCNKEMNGLVFAAEHTVFKIDDKLNSQVKLHVISSLVTKQACVKFGLEKVVFQSLMDFRKPAGQNYKMLVADCHIGVTGIRHVGEDDLNFMNRFAHMFEQEHEKSGLNVSELVFGTFPKLDSHQERLLKAYESAPIKINYLGEKTQAEAAQIVANFASVRQSLSKMRRQIRFQCFSVGNELHILQLNQFGEEVA